MWQRIAIATNSARHDAATTQARPTTTLTGRGLSGQIANKGEKAFIRPVSAGTFSARMPGTTCSIGSNAATISANE